MSKKKFSTLSVRTQMAIALQIIRQLKERSKRYQKSAAYIKALDDMQIMCEAAAIKYDSAYKNLDPKTDNPIIVNLDIQEVYAVTVPRKDGIIKVYEKEKSSKKSGS